MIVELKCGRGHFPVRVPAGVTPAILRKRQLPPVADPATAVANALAHPDGSPPLAEIASGKRSACILICDITRPVPNHLFLRPIIETITDAGIPASEITVLVATGLHRPNLGDELSELVGDPWVTGHVRVENHYARREADHVDLGLTTTRNTPIHLDRRFALAELRIATGLVEPHFMAGYSGGRKVIVPGVAGEETIRTLHSARFMADPAAQPCRLADNPLHEEQLEIVARLGDVHSLNTVLDEHRRLSFVNFGELIASHEAAVELARASCLVETGRRYSTVVTSSAGYPLDKTYYQTVKGMVTPIDILAEDGDMIVVADCSEGLGSDAFRAAQERLLANGPDALADELFGKQLADIDEWQTQMQIRSMKRGRITLHSPGLPPPDRRLTAVRWTESVEQSIEDSVERTGDANVAFIPEGPYVVPVVAISSTAGRS